MKKIFWYKKKLLDPVLLVLFGTIKLGEYVTSKNYKLNSFCKITYNNLQILKLDEFAGEFTKLLNFRTHLLVATGKVLSNS